MSDLCASGFVEVSGDNYMVSTTPQYKLRRLNKPEPHQKMTKEEFLIEWVLARAAFREDFSGCAAARAAEDVWYEIQRLKDRTK